jgi:hypothetical protein
MVFHRTKTLFYLTVRITRHSNHPSAQRSPLLQFAVSRGPRNLVYRTVVNITFLLAIFDEGAGNIEIFSVGT